MPEHLKSRVREELAAPANDLAYSELRKRFLKEFGPIEPIAFYKRRLHHLQCATASEAKERITSLLELHNRAAKDEEGESALRPKSLCYCFMDALPVTLRKHLEGNYSLASTDPQPLEKLFKMAKAKEDADCVTENAFLTQTCSGRVEAAGKPRKRSRATSDNASLSNVLTLLAQKLDRGPARRPPGNPCPNCGRATCFSPSMCPAQGRECYRCHKTGHFGNVCRSTAGTGAPRAPGQFNGNGQRSFRRVYNDNPQR